MKHPSDSTINRSILRLAVPSILANITVPLVGIVDLAIAGHIGDATAMGAVALGTMLFDLLYWNMGFLRAGTGGVTAQAFGRGDSRSAVDAFSQGIATALGVAVLIILLQWWFVDLAFLVIDCTPEVEEMARQYFFVRIWAVPAALCLMVFRGWFIGMQNTVLPMIVDITVNLLNVAASIICAVPCGMGVRGIALGTVIAQWSGMLLASVLMAVNFKEYLPLMNIRESVRWKYIKGMFGMNANLIVRSLMMLVVYSGFTALAAKYGDVELAVASLMMKLLLFYSYFTDGFAYAGEALVGRYIGSKEKDKLLRTIMLDFNWSIAIGIVSTVVYAVAGRAMVLIFSDDPAVIAGCEPYLFWLVLMPVISCVAFTWDGIYIGATASRAMRNCMIFSAAAYVATYIALKGSLGIQALYLAYFVHLAVRTIYMTLMRRKYVLDRAD